MSSLDTCNQTITRGPVQGDHWYDLFKRFCQTIEYIEIDWLLLISLDRVRTENDELVASHSQLKSCMNDPRASMSALKETLLTCSWRAYIGENQTQNLILQDSKLICQPPMMSTVKVRVLLKRKGILKIGMWTCWSWGLWTPKIWWVFFADTVEPSNPKEED